MNSGFKLLISRSGDRSDGRRDSMPLEHLRTSHAVRQVRAVVVAKKVCPKIESWVVSTLTIINDSKVRG